VGVNSNGRTLPDASSTPTPVADGAIRSPTRPSTTYYPSVVALRTPGTSSSEVLSQPDPPGIASSVAREGILALATPLEWVHRLVRTGLRAIPRRSRK
jgi:hypothetical protein